MILSLLQTEMTRKHFWKSLPLFHFNCDAALPYKKLCSKYQHFLSSFTKSKEHMSNPFTQNKSNTVTVSSHGVLKMTALHTNIPVGLMPFIPLVNSGTDNVLVGK